jgi:LuxR family transcriptional regulator, maltose regulon positive regulatory protein
MGDQGSPSEELALSQSPACNEEAAKEGQSQMAPGFSNGSAGLIATKIRVPRRRPDLLPRPRLVSFVHARLDRKLLLVSAPAGYGKTTLLADFAQDTDWPVCWYTLDPFDRDPRAFLEYLIASIAHRFPAFGERTRALLRETTDLGSNPHPLVATLVREIYQTIPEYFVLILDDHHTVEDQEQVNQLLDLFLTYVDENCHVILASRTLPALPNLSLLVARRQAAGMSIDELRFTPLEIQALAERQFGLSLSLGQADLLAQRTGGWITGLLLTAAPRWQQAQSDVALRGWIDLDLHDYLSRQVLDQQSAPLRDFLLASSVLEELNVELCREVLGIGEPASLLDQLRARRLFVLEFEGDDSQLRYNDLFREFLLASLRRQDAARFCELMVRAAGAYASRGEWERAVSRYLELQEYEAVAQIIHQIGGALFEAGRWDTLAGWIDALPESIRGTRPEFLMLRGKIHAERASYGPALALFERAKLAFSLSGDLPRAALALATSASILRIQGKRTDALACCHQALALATGNTPQERRPRAQAYGNIGLCQLESGQITAGRESLQQALRLYLGLDDLYNVASTQHDLGLNHERAGDLEGAIAYYQAALQSWKQLGSPGPWANTLNGLGVIYSAQGRYDDALPILNEAISKARKAGDLRVEAYAWASLGDLHRDLGAYGQAREAYTQALETATSAHIGFIVTYALDALGNASRLQGQLAQARRYLLRAMDQAQANGSAYETALCHASLGTLDRDEGDLLGARRHLDQAVEVFEASGLVQELARACLHRAYVMFQAGQREASLADLGRTLALTAQLGADQFIVVDGPVLLPVLRYALKQEVGWDVLPDLIERIEAHRERSMPVMAQATTETPLRATLNIYALGDARVELDGRAVQWPVTQSRDLFFCLLQYPFGLRKERIGEILWPDHAPHKLDGIFRSTLYRLRRALSRQVILFEDDLYRFSRPSGYWLDVEAFDRLLDEASRPTPPDKVIGFLEGALALYRGDYLQGIYADWTVLERERLRSRYLVALETLAQLYATGRNLRRAIELYQRVLCLDPYREAVHRDVMRCYQRLGDRAAAIRQYQTCVEVLREDLGLSPAKETEEAYLEIIQ